MNERLDSPARSDDDSDYRATLLDRIEAFTDRRAERYWQLLAIMNGWPPVPSTISAWEWFGAALRAQRPPS